MSKRLRVTFAALACLVSMGAGTVGIVGAASAQAAPIHLPFPDELPGCC